MDEFETDIKQAKQPIEPRKDFVETTMKAVSQTTPRRKFSRKIWIPSAVGAGALVIAALLFLPLLQGTTKQNNQTVRPLSSSNQQTQSPTQANSQAATSTTIPPAGTDDASLQSDLNGINSSMTQENSDQSNADSNLNDSSQQITVPSS